MLKNKGVALKKTFLIKFVISVKKGLKIKISGKKLLKKGTKTKSEKKCLKKAHQVYRKKGQIQII